MDKIGPRFTLPLNEPVAAPETRTPFTREDTP